jgi:mannose-6-phosphate isomerase-like protein (cupin superfamily)
MQETDIDTINTYVRGTSDTRPWGRWETLETGPGFTVKRIDVLPGAQLSLQRHRFRAEHWTIARGNAQVTIDDRIVDARTGDSLLIPLGSTHRLCNAGTELLVVIETQLGSHLDENDIERFEDLYGRAQAA